MLLITSVSPQPGPSPPLIGVTIRGSVINEETGEEFYSHYINTVGVQCLKLGVN